MSRQDFAKTPLAKQKHAEFIMKVALKIHGIVLTGLLGSPVIYWFTEERSREAFNAYLIILACGAIAAIWLQRSSTRIIDELTGNAKNNCPLPIAAPSDTTNPLAIQITHGNTHISIYIQQEKNDAQ